MTLDPRPLTHHPGNPHGYPDYTWPMVWVLQDAELWPIEQWVAHQGVEKFWYREVTVAAGFANLYTIYTVPAGKKLYVCSYTEGGQGKHRFATRGAGNVLKAGYSPAYGSLSHPITPPATVLAGQILEVYFLNEDSSSYTFITTVHGYELDV